MKKIAVYPGSFDPLTTGHLDIIKRCVSSGVADHLVVGIAKDSQKKPIFNLNERIELAKNDIRENLGSDLYKKITVVAFEGLLINFAKKENAKILIRGLRAISDFEYEFQMASMNKRLDSNLETVFLMASEKEHFVSSRFIREVNKLGGDISSFVGKNVKKALSKIQKKN